MRMSTSAAQGRREIMRVITSVAKLIMSCFRASFCLATSLSRPRGIAETDGSNQSKSKHIRGTLLNGFGILWPVTWITLSTPWIVSGGSREKNLSLCSGVHEWSIASILRSNSREVRSNSPPSLCD
jgi:hypothetical protein